MVFNKVERFPKSEIPLKVYLFYRLQYPLRGSDCIDAWTHGESLSPNFDSSEVQTSYSARCHWNLIRKQRKNMKKRPVRPVLQSPRCRFRLDVGGRFLHKGLPECDGTMAMGGTTGLCFCTLRSIPTFCVWNPLWPYGCWLNTHVRLSNSEPLSSDLPLKSIEFRCSNPPWSRSLVKLNPISCCSNPTWLVVYLPLWKMWKPVGMMIPNIWKVIKNVPNISKPPTSYFLVQISPQSLLQSPPLPRWPFHCPAQRQRCGRRVGSPAEWDDSGTHWAPFSPIGPLQNWSVQNWGWVKTLVPLVNPKIAGIYGCE